jgi:hypothetical protein
MGLDVVEFVMSVEDSLGIAIPDAEAGALNTPGRLIDWCTNRLPSAAVGGCLSQRAFYLLRRAVRRHAPPTAPLLRPDTSLLEVWPKSDRARAWAAVHDELGLRSWPRLARLNWLPFTTPRLHLARAVVRYMVARDPLSLKAVGEGWTRNQVAEVVHGLIREELGISRETYTESSHWVEDMGAD